MTNDRDLTPDLEALLHDAATGDLSDEDARRLRALMADDPSLADLLDEQQAMAGALAAEVAPLTDLERARLRQGILDEVAPVATAPTPSAPRWARWAFSAAAVLVIVVGVASVLVGGGFFGGGGDASDGDDSTMAVSEADGAEESATDDAAFDRGEVAEAPESEGAADEASDADGGAEGGAGADTSGSAFPACPGEVVEAEGLVSFDSVEDAAVALGAEVPTEWTLEFGEPMTLGDGTTVVLTWFDATGSLTRQVELALSSDGMWTVSRSIDCTA